MVDTVETVTQQIGAFVRDNGGNPWDALNVALARLDLATARAEAAEAEVERLRAALAEALDPNTEWTSSTWAWLLAIRDGDYFGHDAAGSDQ
jgi:hypothetical protein